MQGGITKMGNSKGTVLSRQKGRKHPVKISKIIQWRGIDVREYGSHLMVNDVVIINEGKILHNIFSVRLDNSEAAQWVISNESEIKAGINRRFREFGVWGGNVDDCYDMIIHEFNSRPDLQFNKNHFGKNSNYQIREYILNRIKFMVQHYRNNLNDRHSVVPFVNNAEANYYMGTVEETMSNTTIMETSETVVETDTVYWDDQMDNLLLSFKEFVNDRSYRKFSHEDFLVNMYLNVEKFNHRQDLETHYQRVADVCNESIELVRLVVKDLADAVKSQDEDGMYILGTIQELLEGKKYGWIPKNIRKSQ